MRGKYDEDYFFSCLLDHKGKFLRGESKIFYLFHIPEGAYAKRKNNVPYLVPPSGAKLELFGAIIADCHDGSKPMQVARANNSKTASVNDRSEGARQKWYIRRTQSDDNLKRYWIIEINGEEKKIRDGDELRYLFEDGKYECHIRNTPFQVNNRRDPKHYIVQKMFVCDVYKDFKRHLYLKSVSDNYKSSCLYSLDKKKLIDTQDVEYNLTSSEDGRKIGNIKIKCRED